MVLPIALLLAICSLAGCSNNSSNPKQSEPADPLDLGEDFNAEYYPKKEDNKVAAIVGGNKMKFDIALDFDGTEDGWQALADEYKRLSGGIVDVELIKQTTDMYIDKLRYEEENPKTDWDIVQGNLLNKASEHCENLANVVRSQKNPYAGNKPWLDVLNKEAYITDVTGGTSYTFMLNSESLSTAWFVNTDTASKAGITDFTPQTWDELIEMLEKYQQAGYKYPLGLALNADSINNSQFSWLLRIYGDYYFRQGYQYTSTTFDSRTKIDSVFTYDKTLENQEADSSFTFSYSRGFCLMMDDSCPYYMGALSDLYKDFIYQFSRLGKYIRPSALNQSFSDVRTAFVQQNYEGGLESPQIMLDYTGKGLYFLNQDKLKNNIDFFDYPTIESDYVEEGTLTRDVGGNGGYLALFRHTRTEQMELNKDFLKFVLSPYGQTIYYRALESSGKTPSGLTTVKNDLVIIPESWKNFFQTDKITFTGLADSNKMLGLGGISFQSVSKVDMKSVSLWQGILRDQITIDTFADEWHSSIHSSWKEVATEHNWKEDSWYYRNFSDPKYIVA